MDTPPPEDHSFAPANHRLITLYLRRRVAGEPLPSATAAYFHDMDIYAAEPSALTTGLQPLPAGKGEGNSWLFFTPVKTKSSTDSRRSRRVGGGVGTWHSEHAPEDVFDDEGNRVGHRQLFSYKDKGGKRSGWSMWEFGAADQEGGETLLVLCKIHQGHAGLRRAGGSATRSSARKRKGTDDDVDKKAAAPVKRRLFCPPAPTPPAVSEDKIGATSAVIRSSRTDTEPSVEKIGVTLDAIPSSRGETEPSKDTPRHVLSFWNQPSPLQQGTISAETLGSLDSFSPRPDASQETIINPRMECPALIPNPDAIPSSKTETEASKDTPRHVLSFWNQPSLLQLDKISAATLRSIRSFSPTPDASQGSLLNPELDAIPSSRTETETSKDAPRSVMSFCGEPSPLQQGTISATLRSLGSFSPRPDEPQKNVISAVNTTMESRPSLIPLPDASQGEMKAFDGAFLMDGSAPPAPQYCYNGSFVMDGSGSDVSGVPLCTPGVEISGPWTGYNTMPSSYSIGNAFHGGFPTYNEFGAGASSSWAGYDMTASCSDAFIGALPTYSDLAISASAGVQYGWGVPSATFLPSAAPSQWCGVPASWSC